MIVQVIANDFHVPYVDRKLWGLFLEFVERIEPDEVYLNGDVLDCRAVSIKFTDRPKDQRVERIKFEVDTAGRMLDDLTNLVPGESVTWLDGNHEWRLARFVAEKAPFLMGTDLLSVKTMLKLGKHGINHCEYGQVIRAGSLLITHGDVVRKESGASARGMLDTLGQSVICGHTHRGGVYYRTTGARTIAAWENFCMCRFDQPYLTSPPNWQAGWSVVHNDGKRRFQVTQVPVFNYQYTYGGESYGLTEKARSYAARIPRLQE